MGDLQILAHLSATSAWHVVGMLVAALVLVAWRVYRKSAEDLLSETLPTAVVKKNGAVTTPAEGTNTDGLRGNSTPRKKKRRQGKKRAGNGRTKVQLPVEGPTTTPPALKVSLEVVPESTVEVTVGKPQQTHVLEVETREIPSPRETESAAGARPSRKHKKRPKPAAVGADASQETNDSASCSVLVTDPGTALVPLDDGSGHEQFSSSEEGHSPFFDIAPSTKERQLLLELGWKEEETWVQAPLTAEEIAEFEHNKRRWQAESGMV